MGTARSSHLPPSGARRRSATVIARSHANPSAEVGLERSAAGARPPNRRLPMFSCQVSLLLSPLGVSVGGIVELLARDTQLGATTNPLFRELLRASWSLRFCPWRSARPSPWRGVSERAIYLRKTAESRGFSTLRRAWALTQPSPPPSLHPNSTSSLVSAPPSTANANNHPRFGLTFGGAELRSSPGRGPDPSRGDDGLPETSLPSTPA